MMNSFPDIIPVFPLSGVIYFPKTNLPLNIFEQRYLNETISASDAHTDWGAMMSVLKGDRNVAFLLGPFIEKWFNKYIKDNSSV